MARLSEPHPASGSELPVRHVASIEPKPEGAQWLVEGLWAASGVGVIGGLPKCLKTWLATELAVSVASGTHALGRYRIMSQGPVLLYAAEDDLPAMRARFEAVANARGISLENLPVYLIDLPQLRLDDPEQWRRLDRTVASVRPRLLVLDPFVRIARVDENSATEVSAVLGSLRALQRQHDVAVLLVHHMRKSPSGHLGQQLRGSGDFAAWYDSGLYLVRSGPSELLLSVEHRGAPAPAPMRLTLASEPSPHLVVLAPTTPPTPPAPSEPLRDAILERLRTSKRPLSTLELRHGLKVRKATLLEHLRALREQNLVHRADDGWVGK